MNADDEMRFDTKEDLRPNICIQVEHKDPACDVPRSGFVRPCGSTQRVPGVVAWQSKPVTRFFVGFGEGSEILSEQRSAPAANMQPPYNTTETWTEIMGSSTARFPSPGGILQLRDV